MKIYLPKFKIILTAVAIIMLSFGAEAQVFEWRLANNTYSAVDPDGGGPANGSATFTLQIHTTSGSVNQVSAISTGWSYQSISAMVPTSAGCSLVNAPSNVVLGAAFTGYAYNSVQECNAVTQTSGAYTFDRIAAGTIEGPGITITTTWIDVFTVTLWTLSSTNPQGGYVAINSGFGGSPAPLTNYAVSDVPGTEYIVNSLTWTTPLALSAVVPVTFTKFAAGCNSNGVLVSWSTAQEYNASHFELQRSTNGTDWKTVAKVQAAGNSAVARNYQQIDLNGGDAFYRIKQVDIDGQYMLTDIVRTNCESKDITYVLYPVPARDRLNVVIRSDRSMKTQLVVYDGIGQVVRKVEAVINNGNNNFTINVSGLAAGQYTIRSTDASLKLNRQFTIAN